MYLATLCLVCFDALHPSQQFISNVGTIRGTDSRLFQIFTDVDLPNFFSQSHFCLRQCIKIATYVIHNTLDRNVNWMSPVEGNLSFVQVKEPYSNLDMLTCRLSSCNPECTKYTCR